MPAARSPGRAYSPTAARNPGQMRRFAERCSLPLRSDLHLAPRQALPPLPPTTPIKGNSRAAYPCESPFMFVLNRLTCSLFSRPRESARMSSLGDVRVWRILANAACHTERPLSAPHCTQQNGLAVAILKLPPCSPERFSSHRPR